MIAGVGEALILRQALTDDLLGRAPVEDALPAGVVGRVEARQQPLEVAVAGDGDAEHLALDPPEEAARDLAQQRVAGVVAQGVVDI